MVCSTCIKLKSSMRLTPHEVLGVDLLSLDRIVSGAVALRQLLQLHRFLLLPAHVSRHVPEDHLRLLLQSICTSSSSDLGKRLKKEKPGKVRVLGNCNGGLLCRTGLEWHSDGTNAVTLLHCRSAPMQGGDTLFVSSTEMLERLELEDKELAKRLVAVYGNRFAKSATSAEDFHEGFRMNATGTRILRESRKQGEAHWKRRMPLVLEDDSSGELFLSVDIRHFEFFEGYDVQESREIMERLLRQGLGWCECLRRSELDPLTLAAVDDGGEWNAGCVYRHKWTTGDTILFDNDTVLHTPTPSAIYETSLPAREMIQIIQAWDG